MRVRTGTTVAITLLAALALTAVSCSSGASTPSAPAQTRAASSTPAAVPAVAGTPGAAVVAPPAAPAGGKRTIAMVGSSDFSPKLVQVSQGETVTFSLKNTGEETHNMIGLGDSNLKSPDVFVLKTIEYDWTAPKKAVTYKVLCTFHSEMSFEIVVK